MKKENVETCDFCGAEVSDELLGVSPENDNVLICEECVEKARKMLQDAKGDNVGVSVFGIKYDGNSKASTIDVTLDLTLWCSPTFDNMKLVEKLGRNINDMKL
ncbi:ClpX C4-type zinc finger protein [Ligilactobacillus animalis]|uniref:ClpX C4-type zinc finger protein n=1 Tax=Ligilactobacillus animalis TaxID=1605 RepID=UPI0026DF0F41|nr:ClpX C4-type zinc finger protein [Ligilactobacillus animalis]MDO5884150.1 ClpX C4-type zinc finger protein [Ligilactobacillus animalis]